MSVPPHQSEVLQGVYPLSPDPEGGVQTDGIPGSYEGEPRSNTQSTNCCSTLFHILHLIKLFVATNFRDKLKIKDI